MNLWISLSCLEKGGAQLDQLLKQGKTKIDDIKQKTVEKVQ